MRICELCKDTEEKLSEAISPAKELSTAWISPVNMLKSPVQLLNILDKGKIF